jgi:hypothetical protein
MHASKFCLSATLCVALFAGCGDDDGTDSDPVHVHDAGLSDGSYEEVPCPEDTPEFAIGMEAVGEEGAITGRLLDADPAPPRKFENDWSVEFVDADGEPLEDVEVVRAWPFMPVHGHDGFYDPDVSALEEPGRYRVDRINMWMRGPWEVHFMLTSESAGDDHVVFDVCAE